MKNRLIGLFILGLSGFVLLNLPAFAATEAKAKKNAPEKEAKTADTKPANKDAKIEDGKKVTLHYKLYVENQLLETADDKDPFIYTQGQHQIVPGLEKGLAGLKVGEHKEIRVKPEEAYGLPNPKAVREISTDKLPAEVPKKVGTILEAKSPQGQVLLVKIKEVKDKTVVVDFNHPLAGKELVFQVDVISVA